MNYLAKLVFETIDENGKEKKIREQHLVEAENVSEAEEKLLKAFGSGISPFRVEGVAESKILSLLK